MSELPIHLVIGETFSEKRIPCDPDDKKPNPPMRQRTIHAVKATCPDCLNAIETADTEPTTSGKAA